MKYISITKHNYQNFLIKEKKGLLSIEPDLVIDFYIFPKIFIINDIAEQCKSYFDSNIIILDAAIELNNSDIRNNYNLLYFKYLTHYDLQPHIYVSIKDNGIFISEEFSAYLSKILFFSPNPINFRWL